MKILFEWLLELTWIVGLATVSKWFVVEVLLTRGSSDGQPIPFPDKLMYLGTEVALVGLLCAAWIWTVHFVWTQHF